MKVIVHDLGTEYHQWLRAKCDKTINATVKAAPCQGCFNCWTKHPAKCFIEDSLKEVCCTIGNADELIIITENCYGTYSPEIKRVLDRSIGQSTPLSIYRGKQMHHALRYGRHSLLRVFAYGDSTPEEKSTFAFITERNALNLGFDHREFVFLESIAELEEQIK